MKLHKKKALRQMNGLGKGDLGEKETDGRLNATQLKATPRLKAATATADGVLVLTMTNRHLTKHRDKRNTIPGHPEPCDGTGESNDHEP